MSIFSRIITYTKAMCGNYEAQFEIGKLFGNMNDKKAQESGMVWLKASCESGYVPACMYLANHYINSNRTDRAITILENCKIADDGQPQALLGQILIGQYINYVDFHYLNQYSKHQEPKPTDVNNYVDNLIKESLPKNNLVANPMSESEAEQLLSKALKFLFIGLEKKHPLAYHAYAIYLLEYAKDKDVQRQYAINLLETACSMNFAPSLQVVAGFHENGAYGYKKDIREGLEKRIRAGETQSKDAQYSLGCMVYSGSGFEVDKERGLSLIQSAADKGHKEAANFLAKLKATNSMPSTPKNR